MFSVLTDSSSTSSSHQSRRSQTSMRAPRPKTTAQKSQSTKEKERHRLQQRRLESGDRIEEAPNVTSKTADQAEEMRSLQRQAKETKAPELPNPDTGVEFHEEEQTVTRMPHNLDLTSESAYLQSTKTTNDLMDQLMQQLNLKMPEICPTISDGCCICLQRSLTV